MQKLRLPEVNLQNFSALKRKLGIERWRVLNPPMSLGDYLEGLKEREILLLQKQHGIKRDYELACIHDAQAEAEKYGPKIEVLQLLQPATKKPFIGFRTICKDFVTVFCLLPGDLVPVALEFKHGISDITLVLPSGVLSKTDLDQPDPLLAAGKREFEEETGLELQSIEFLRKGKGIAVSGRQSKDCFYPLIGTVKEPIIQSALKLDENELLKTVLVPLKDWLYVLEVGNYSDIHCDRPVIENANYAATYLALRRLGRLVLS